MTDTIKVLQDHALVLCSLKKKSLLGANAHKHSIGWGYLAPVMAQRMNLIAEDKSPEFSGKPLEFLLLNPEHKELSEAKVSWALDTVMESTLRRPLRTVWVLAPQSTIMQLMGVGIMDCPDAYYFRNDFPSEETKPYEIYSDGKGKYRARLLYEDQIFEMN